MDHHLIERAKTFDFISYWFQWSESYKAELSNRNNRGYGYQEGAFFPDGAGNGKHHLNWQEFYQSLASNGIPYTSIHALFGYDHYNSCRLYIDSQGRNFTFP
ncbi:MAG: hypothetical protein KAT17_10515 [Candidatus Aminicenantes bacterium]|nr:hypothetical protein [Candidatus Aminicenantes bacterium]